MNYRIGVISGDGIGPEIVAEAKKVLDCISKTYGHTFEYEEILMGGCSIDATGVPLTDEAIAQALGCDAVLMGSIGGNTATSPWYKLEPHLRPEAGLLKLRKSLNLFANLRPAYLYEELKEACPLRDDIIGDGFDMIIMRELTGGLYFGERKTEEKDGILTAIDTLAYNENEIRRIAVRGFDIAMKRRKKEPENLCELGVGGRAVVTEIRSSGAMKRRLADMGILPGTVVCVQKMAPLGDPIQISLRGYELLLRGSEAREIMIRPIA